MAHYLHLGKTTTGQYYAEPTFKSLDVIKQKQWRKLSLRWLFHDNAPAHKSLVAQQALCNCEFVQLNHPAYSLDLAPSDYFLIRNLKYCFRGAWFMDDESLKIAVCRSMVWESKQKNSILTHKQLRIKVEKMQEKGKTWIKHCELTKIVRMTSMGRYSCHSLHVIEWTNKRETGYCEI